MKAQASQYLQDGSNNSLGAPLIIRMAKEHKWSKMTGKQSVFE